MGVAVSNPLDDLVAAGTLHVFEPPTGYDLYRAISATNPAIDDKVTTRRTLRDMIVGSSGDYAVLNKALKAVGPEETTKAGKFSTRLRKALADIHPTLPHGTTLTKVGEMCAGFDIKFVRGPFEWKAGAFGDADSCFMRDTGCRKDAKHYLHKIGAVCCQVSKAGKGIGRCWVFGRDQVLFLTNAYGKPMTVLAPLLAKMWGLKHTPSPGHGDTYLYQGGTFYINRDGHLLYPEGVKVPSPARFDLYRDFNLPVLRTKSGITCFTFGYDPLKDQFYYGCDTLTLTPYNQ